MFHEFRADYDLGLRALCHRRVLPAPPGTPSRIRHGVRSDPLLRLTVLPDRVLLDIEHHYTSGHAWIIDDDRDPLTGDPEALCDPAIIARIATIQASHFDELAFHRFWWLPGIAVAARIEAGFKSGFVGHNIRGEWFDMSPKQAERQVEAAIERLGIWSLTQSEMEHLFDDWVRKKWGIPRHAPSPLAGRAPRKDEPWQAPKKRQPHRSPSLPSAPWDDDE